MLYPRLTNCKECNNIETLIKNIDCKLASMANDLYNNTVFILNLNINKADILDLLNYKRILTFKYCMPDYATKHSCISLDAIISKIKLLTHNCNVIAENRSGEYIPLTTTTTTLNPLADVIINEQIWKKFNLSTSTYLNGDEIPQITDPDQWANLTTGAWCYYDNDETNGEIYGKLYNWYAINDPRGFGEVGYRVPSYTDWSNLNDYLISQTLTGGDLKETGISHWTTPNLLATNSTMFTALPGGQINIVGFYNYKNTNGYWASSTEFSLTDMWTFNLEYNTSSIDLNSVDKNTGISVRLIKN